MRCRILTLALSALLGSTLGCGPQGRGGAAGSSGVLPGGAAGAAEGWRGRVLSAPLQRPSFVLRDTEGRAFDFQSRTAGRVTLLFFGYTSCPDVCPTHLSRIAAAMQILASQDPRMRAALDVVFVGTDAARDDATRVRSWLDHFDPSFIGLVGSEEELRVAQLAAAVPPAERAAGGRDDDYTLVHASYVLLYTPDDQAHLRYPVETCVEDWVQDLRRLLVDGWTGA